VVKSRQDVIKIPDKEKKVGGGEPGTRGWGGNEIMQIEKKKKKHEGRWEVSKQTKLPPETRG